MCMCVFGGGKGERLLQACAWVLEGSRGAVAHPPPHQPVSAAASSTHKCPHTPSPPTHTHVPLPPLPPSCICTLVVPRDSLCDNGCNNLRYISAYLPSGRGWQTSLSIIWRGGGIIYPSICLSIHQSTIYPSKPINISIYPSIHLPFYQSIHLSIYPSTNLSIYQPQSVHLPSIIWQGGVSRRQAAKQAGAPSPSPQAAGAPLQARPLFGAWGGEGGRGPASAAGPMRRRGLWPQPRSRPPATRQ